MEDEVSIKRIKTWVRLSDAIAPGSNDGLGQFGSAALTY